MLKKLILADWLKGYEDWALVVLRLALATVFIAHGSMKIFVFTIPGVAAGFEKMGFHPGIFWGTLVTLAEFLGGIGILVGFATRWAALAVAVDMLVATITFHLPQGFFINTMGPTAKFGVEFTMTLFAAAVALFLTGAGRISVDGLLEGRK